MLLRVLFFLYDWTWLVDCWAYYHSFSLQPNLWNVFDAQRVIPHLIFSYLNFQGALRNFILSLQTEIVSGDVLRDALELGATDLHGIFQVAKELLGRYYRSSYTNNSSEL